MGKVNFTNLSRYSDLSERTYRRQYRQPFDFTRLNRLLFDASCGPSPEVIAAIDCTFIPKSGRHTPGLGWFFNGSASRSEKGLEVSVIALVDVAQNTAYALSAQQTPAPPPSLRPKRRRDTTQPIPASAVESAEARLAALPDLQAKRVAREVVEACQADLTLLAPKPNRVDYALEQVRATWQELPTKLRYLAMDGWYAKARLVDGVMALAAQHQGSGPQDLQVISKLRVDSRLFYLYSGPQKARGAPKKYGGKVEREDLSKFTFVRELEPGVKLYEAIVWSVALSRKIKVALLVNTRMPHQVGHVLLFSTDLDLDAETLLKYYKARFQIEFVFRDSKQFTGLCDAQTRDAQRLHFHFNASLTALNLAKYQQYSGQADPKKQAEVAPNQDAKPFSMASYKRVALTKHLIDHFIFKLDLDPTSIKSHPSYPELCQYGVIVA